MTATATLAEPVVDQTATYDGDESTGLVYGPPTLDTTEYGFVVDFGGDETVDGLELVAGNAQDYPRSFAVEYDDGGSWQSIGTDALTVSTGQTTTLSFPAQTTSRLRVTETDDSTAAWWRLHEITAFDGETALDRSGWTVTRLGVGGSPETQNADAVVDGTASAAARWQSQNAIASKEMAVEISLGSQRSIAKVDLVHSSAGDTPSTFDLEYSPDGSTWQTAKSGIAGSAEMTITLDSPVTATKLRISERDDQTAPNWWSLEEVRPYTAGSGDGGGGGDSDTTPPEPPASVAVDAVTDTSVTVAWEGSPSADVAVYSVGVGEETTQTVGRTAQFTGLPPGTTYDVSVSAIDTSSNESTAVTATATTEVAVDYSQQFTKLGFEAGQIEFDPAAAVDSATADYRINGGDAQSLTLSTVEGEQRYTGTLPDALASGDVIRYTITYARAGQEVVTDEYEVTFQGDTIPPAPPVDLAAESHDDTSVTLSWTAASDADSGLAGYELVVDGGETLTGLTGTTTTVDGLSPRTDYTFALRAVDAAGNTSTFARTSQRTDASSDASPPPAPTPVTVTEAGETTLSLAWSGVEDAESGLAHYEVTVSGLSTTQTVTTTATTTAVTGLASGTDYTVEVVAVDAFDNRSEPATTETTTAIPPTESTLTAPTGLSTTPGATSVAVSWAVPDDTGTGIDRYVVERRRDGEVGDSVIVTDTSAELPGLTPETTYTVAVRAVDTVGATAESTATVTTTVQTDTSVATPANLTATPGQTELAISWDPVTDESGIDTYRVALNGERRTGTSATETTLSGLSPGTTYEVSVTAVDTVGNEATTTEQFGTTADESVAAPTGLVVDPTAQTSLTLSWTAPDDVSGIAEYRVYRSTGEIGGDATPIDTVTGATSYQFDGLSAGTAYTLGVAAVDGAGNVSTPTTTTAETDPVPDTGVSPPSNLTATQGQTTVSLSWDAVTDESGVSYTVRTLRNGDTVDSQSVSGTSVTIAELAPNTTYAFEVVVEDGAGNTASSSVTATTDPVPPTAPDTPTDLTVDGKTVSTVDLSWTAPGTPVDHYAIRVGGTAVLTTEATSATVTGLDAGTAYDVTVVAIGAEDLASEPTPTTRVTTATVTRDRTTDALSAWRHSRPPTDEQVPHDEGGSVDYGTVRAMVAEMEEDGE